MVEYKRIDILKMIEYKRIDILEGIDVDKTNKSKECMLCFYYWYFLNKNVSYGPYICDGCYNISQKSKDFKNIAIAYIKKKKCIQNLFSTYKQT